MRGEEKATDKGGGGIRLVSARNADKVCLWDGGGVKKRSSA